MPSTPQSKDGISVPFMCGANGRRDKGAQASGELKMAADGPAKGCLMLFAGVVPSKSDLTHAVSGGCVAIVVASESDVLEVMTREGLKLDDIEVPIVVVKQSDVNILKGNNSTFTLKVRNREQYFGWQSSDMAD